MSVRSLCELGEVLIPQSLQHEIPCPRLDEKDEPSPRWQQVVEKPVGRHDAGEKGDHKLGEREPVGDIRVFVDRVESGMPYWVHTVGIITTTNNAIKY